MKPRPSDPWERFSPRRDEDGAILHFGDPPAELEALRQGRALHPGGRERVLGVGGADRVDLLQRIGAGDLACLERGEFPRLPFTDAKGRLVDVPWVFTQQDRLLLVCGPGRRQRLQDWIQGYTILEDVVCEAHDEWMVIERELAGVPMLREEVEAPGAIAELVEGGLRPVGVWAHAQACAEALRMRPGYDLDERFHPLEAGLREYIAFDKGCFIGQEVVARLENYDKVRRRPALAYGPSVLGRDTELRHAGRRGAQVVHSANRLDSEGAYALALLEREIQEGAALLTEDGAEWIVQRAAAL